MKAALADLARFLPWFTLPGPSELPFLPNISPSHAPTHTSPWGGHQICPLHLNTWSHLKKSKQKLLLYGPICSPDPNPGCYLFSPHNSAPPDNTHCCLFPSYVLTYGTVPPFLLTCPPLASPCPPAHVMWPPGAMLIAFFLTILYQLKAYIAPCSSKAQGYV